MPRGPSNNTVRPDAFNPSMQALRAKLNDHSIKEQDHFRAKQLSPGVYSKEGLYSKSEHGKTSAFSNRKPRFDAAKDYVRQAVKEYLGDAKAADRIVDTVLTDRSQGMTKAQLRTIVKHADRKFARMKKNSPGRQKRLAAAKQKLRTLIEQRKSAQSAGVVLPESDNGHQDPKSPPPAPPKTVVYKQPESPSNEDGQLDVAPIGPPPTTPDEVELEKVLIEEDDPQLVSGDNDPKARNPELNVPKTVVTTQVDSGDDLDVPPSQPAGEPSGAEHLKQLREQFVELSDRYVSLEGKLTEQEAQLFQQLLGHANDAIVDGDLGEAEALMNSPLVVAGLSETPTELYDKIAERSSAEPDPGPDGLDASDDPGPSNDQDNPSQPSQPSQASDAPPAPQAPQPSGVAPHLQHPVQSQAISYLRQAGVSAELIDQMVELGTFENPGLLEDMIRGAGSPEVFAKTLVQNFNTALQYNLHNRSQAVIDAHLHQHEEPIGRVEVARNGDSFHAAATLQIEKLDGADATPTTLRAAIHDYLAAATRTREAFDAFLQRLPKDVAASLDYEKTRRDVDSGRVLLDAASGGAWGHVAHALALADITGRPVEVIGFDQLNQKVTTYTFEPTAEDVVDDEPSDENANDQDSEDNDTKPGPIRLIYNGLTHFDAAIPD